MVYRSVTREYHARSSFRLWVLLGEARLGLRQQSAISAARYGWAFRMDILIPNNGRKLSEFLISSIVTYPIRTPPSSV